ncbi:type II toxin-antitoxin system RelE/ParE family toxin [Rhodopirellula europaea]|uniref:type II toxin-antitoxin system RelE/ParE family toxin n=1 Tax=Rhodopirellula europaea TaxID=1263866 RepID=UPI001F46ADCB|nr:type II toxin-antitoxin system RelE/ParE family toxin [Rhodopirellula europaea]
MVQKLREKCCLLAKDPDVGDARPELGNEIRSTYVGSYVIFFCRVEGFLEIVRVIRGDFDEPKI